jgi:Flp pilus assembly protein TadG
MGKAADTFWRSLRRLMDRTEGVEGVAAIEFAILATILILLMICTVDIGMGFYRKMQIQNAAQVGAQYAMLHGFSAGSISAAVTGATSFSGISASPDPTQYCGCPGNTGIGTTTCGSTCADGTTAATYVSVSAQGTYDTLLSYPLIPRSFTLTAQSTVRTQ